jgi:serine/threonine protein kinase
VHRDIKPENIFIKGKSCVLGDYGLIKNLSNLDTCDRSVFKLSPGAGMPFYYRTPDLVKYANNESELTVKTDIFQLGLVLAELFTGSNPLIYSNDILAPVKLQRFSRFECNHGGLIINILKRMLAEDPTERPLHQEIANAFEVIFIKLVSDETKDGKRLFS